MISRPENPNPLREDEDVLELVAGGRQRRKKPRAKVKTEDPLHQLFVSNDPKQTGECMSNCTMYHISSNRSLPLASILHWV